MINIFRSQIDKDKYFICKYYLKSKTTLRDAAWNLAIGQSIGNPKVRNQWETDELLENSSCKILVDSSPDEGIDLDSLSEGMVDIAFPLCNIDFETDGISQLLCQTMGGQMDIDNVLKCHLIDIDFPEHVVKKHFKGPKFGFSKIREFVQSFDKPLLGGIVKPKVGITPEVLCEMVKEMIEGGVDFIKEDEIMSNPSICPIEVRVPMIKKILDEFKIRTGKNVVYCVCINADSPYILDRVKQVYKLGGNGVHINFWSGLGVYKAVRELDLPIFVHFQKSGDKILTNKNHDYHIRWKLVCKLAGMSGVDFIHAGMIGGYMDEDPEEMKEVIKELLKWGVVPALSCGMHPGLIDYINNEVGTEYMANVGGAIHGHPGGTLSGVKAMRQSIDQDYKEEYHQAVKKWGIKEKDSLDDTFLVIQGPTDKHKEMIQRYKGYPRVVWATWRSEPEERIQEIKDAGFHVVLIYKPKNPGKGNLNMQTVSSAAGIKKAKELGAKYVMKIRQDLEFNDIQKSLMIMKEKVKKENKLCFFCYHDHRGGYCVDYFSFGDVEESLLFWDLESKRRDINAEVIMLENYIQKKKWKIGRGYSVMSQKFHYVLEDFIEHGISIKWHKIQKDIVQKFKTVREFRS